MTTMIRFLRLTFLILTMQLLSACQLAHDMGKRFDIHHFDKSQIADFNLLPEEQVRYYSNVILGKTINSTDLSYEHCSNDKILLTNKYLYLIENPEAETAFEYQLKIGRCGGDAIRPTKRWKIPYNDIIKVEEYGSRYSRYKFYFKDKDMLTTIIFIKTYMYDPKIFKAALREAGGIEIAGKISKESLRGESPYWSVSNCNVLSREWGEWNDKKVTVLNFFSKNENFYDMRPPFWKETSCITQTGLWSKDGAAANTIHEANDQGALYTGDLLHGNNCGPYSSSWVSTVEYDVNLCEGKWKALTDENRLDCLQSKKPMNIKLRRLSIGFNRCYLYGEHADGYLNNSVRHEYLR